MYQIRQAAVAGAFYPAGSEELSGAVADLLAHAHAQTDEVVAPPKALIVPHAGYIYSGATAALAYAQLTGLRSSIRRVVLLGPAHRVPVRGLALAGVASFATPLGKITVDLNATAALTRQPQVTVDPAAHALEHSLEVHLPFLQAALDHFSLVPLVVGDASATEVAQVLELLWGGPETLIVISSDLSHYLPYPKAQAMDQDTVRQILDLRGPIGHRQACGGTPISGLLLAAKRHHLRPRLLGLCNSGDTAGEKERVVGYAAFAFSEPPHGVQ